MEIFSKGLTHDSGKQLEVFLCLLLNKIGLEIMFADHPIRKQAYLHSKIRILPSRPMKIFFKQVNTSLWSKIEFFFFACF